jgi:hypothetical protein
MAAMSAVAVSARVLTVLARSVDQLDRLGQTDYFDRSPKGATQFTGAITVPGIEDTDPTTFLVHFDEDRHYVEVILP